LKKARLSFGSNGLFWREVLWGLGLVRLAVAFCLYRFTSKDESVKQQVVIRIPYIKFQAIISRKS
jgi:hypothetical protein